MLKRKVIAIISILCFSQMSQAYTKNKFLCDNFEVMGMIAGTNISAKAFMFPKEGEKQIEVIQVLGQGYVVNAIWFDYIAMEFNQESKKHECTGQPSEYQKPVG